MKYFFCLLISCIPASLVAQKTLRGIVKNKETGQPIVSASVYLSNTSTGTASGMDGSFAIGPFPEGRYDLVVSAVGYDLFSTFVNAAELPDSLVVQLVPRVKEMEEVVVMPFLKDGWQQWGQFFLDNLIGLTPNAEDCKLLNREVVRFRFNQKENYLEAVATEPLLIENNALGYSLSYDLVQFRVWKRLGYCLYLGYPLFKDLETNSKKKQQRWLSNRKEAYLGSVMHFMRSLYNNSLLQDGFEVRRVLRPKEKSKHGFYIEMPPVLLPATLPGDSIAYAFDSTTVQLLFSNSLQVLHKSRNNPRSYIRYLSGSLLRGQNIPLTTGGRLNYSPPNNQPAVSEIFAAEPAEGVQLLYNGHYYSSTNLVSMQYWAWSEKLSNLLPLDYGNPQPANARKLYPPK